MRTELISVSIRESRQYECISYCWGRNPKRTHPILLNNRQYFVPPNVLTILRRRSSFFKERLIWIDFICINQDDKKEKGEQFCMMRDIYSRGVRVSVCLGDADNSRRALNMITYLANLHRITPREYWKSLIADLLSRKRTDRTVATDWSALVNVLRHEWFERIWIVQEVACSPWATVLYGSYQVTWEDLILATKVLIDDACIGLLHLVYNGGDDSIPGSLPKGIIHSVFIEGCKSATLTPMPIYKLLLLFHTFKATQGVDKIFALVGLSRERAELMGLVNYEKKPTDVLVNVATFLLEKGYLLQVLHLAGIGWDARTPEDIPSWVVEWTKSREPVPIAHPSASRPYRAATGRPPHVRLCNTTTISVGGLAIGSVEEVLPGGVPVGNWETMSSAGLEVAAFDQCVQSFHRMEDFVHRRLPNGYFNGQSAQEVLWRTLTGDRTTTERPIPQHHMRHIERCHRVVRASYDCFINNGNTFAPGSDTPPEFSGIFANVEDAAAFAAAMHDSPLLIGGMHYVRTLCVTNNHLLALVPQLTRPKDIICLIFGGQVPFVLRPINNGAEIRYRLVGECYLHGLMDGEGLYLNQEATDFEIF
jgi:hypothetical protein